VNGAAARLACPGDLIIVCTFAVLDEKKLENYKPTLVYFNDQNEICHSSHSIPVQAV
jgi:aspartate 1-decarboxylase